MGMHRHAALVEGFASASKWACTGLPCLAAPARGTSACLPGQLRAALNCIKQGETHLIHNDMRHTLQLRVACQAPQQDAGRAEHQACGARDSRIQPDVIPDQSPWGACRSEHQLSKTALQRCTMRLSVLQPGATLGQHQRVKAAEGCALAARSCR